MADGTDPVVDPGKDPVNPDPGKDPVKPDLGAGDLGAAGKAALDAERAARKVAERAVKDAQTALDALTASTKTEAEKAEAERARAVAEAKAEVRKEVLAEANARLLKSEIRAAAGGRLADPGDAAVLLGDLDRFVDSNGEPDPKAISSAIDKLVKDKPYLAAAGTRAGPLPGGGAKPATGFTINDEIRQMAGRG